MSPRLVVLLLPALAALGGCGDLGALAAPNPLQRQPGTAPAPGTPAATPAAMPQSTIPLRTVDFVKPGARLIYYGGSSTKSTQPGGKTSAGVGMTAYDVIAVTKTHVLMNVSTYLGTGQKDGVYTYALSAPLAVTGMDVTGGSALWMPPKELAALRTGSGVQVTRGPYPLGGQSYNAVTIFIPGKDSASRQVFDAGTGLKLAMQDASGPMLQGYTDPVMRHVQSFGQYESYRQSDVLVGPAPPWVATTRALTYSGQFGMSVGPPVSMTTTVEFTDRGPDWAIASLSTQMQAFGSQPSQPEVKVTVEGPGKRHGLWVSPQVLARLQPGVVDRDQTLNTTLSYQVQGGPMGQLGVFTETNDRGTYSMISGYNLQDGVLTYAQTTQRETGYTVTTQLQGRQ